MSEPTPDKFGPDWRDSWHSARPTPVELGGPHDHDDGAAGRMLGGARAGGVDMNATGKLLRLLDDFRGRPIAEAAQAVALAGVPTVLGLGGCPQGYVRSLRRVNVGPADYVAGAGAFPAGTTVILVSGEKASPGAAYPNASGLSVVSLTTIYPAEGTWSAGEVTIMPGQWLTVVVVGLAAGVQVVASAQLVETASVGGEIFGLVR